MAIPEVLHLPIQGFELIGKGKQATVYKATRLDTNSVVAIKRSPRSRRCFAVSLNEVAVLRHLSGHKNVLRLYESIEDLQARVLITEYCDGGDLLTHLRDHGPYLGNEGAARELFRPIVSAVNYAHERGYLHRDLKLENIYLSLSDGERRIVVGDWGMATRWSLEERLREHAGSPHYLAPEAMRELPAVGPEVDVWAMGVILYAIAHAKMPFYPDNYDTNGEYAEAMEAGGYNIDWHCSPPLRKLIRAMLDPVPLRRISCESVLESTWITSKHSNYP